MLMSQQRPDRIKQMLDNFWQHTVPSTQQAIELLAMQRQPCAGLIISPAVIPVWFAAMVVLTSDDSTEDVSCFRR